MIRVEDRLKQYEPFFNKWRLHDSEPLGSGSSGVVYSIYHGELEAALKVIPIPRDEVELNSLMRQYGSEDRVRKELIDKYNLAREEIDIMKKLWGESHLVCFEDHYIVDRTDTFGWDVLIRMEKLVRIDHFLREDMLKKFGYKRDSELILRIWDDLLQGLQVCQHQNIVHLDIKPENIFYAPGGDHFKLGDFGVAVKSIGGQKVMESMIVGTEEYMAPEVRKGAGGDTRSDIYSLALVIYQFFNNDRLPFMPSGTYTEEDRRRAIDKRLSGERVPRIKGVSAGTMELLNRCLEHEPGNRYQTVEEVKRDLRKIVYGEETRSSSKTLPILAAVASLGLAGVLILLGVTATRGGDEQPVPTEVPAIEAMQPTAEPVETQFVEPEATPVPTIPAAEPTGEAAGDAMTAVGSVRFAGMQGGGAVGWMEAQISGNVSMKASLNGQDLGVFRISGSEGQRPAADISWPADGLYFAVNDNGSNETQHLSVTCASAAGDALYSYETDFYWMTADSGARVFVPGQAPAAEVTEAPTEAPRAGIVFSERKFTIDEGGVAKAGQNFTYIGTAEPGEQLSITLNDEPLTTVQADESGAWEVTLPEDALNAAGDCVVGAYYDDGTGVAALNFTYSAERAPIAVTECRFKGIDDDIAKAGIGDYIYVGTAEAGERLDFMVNDTVIDSVTVNEEGYWAMYIPEDVLAAEGSCTVYVIYAEDGDRTEIDSFIYDAGVSGLTVDSEYRQGDQKLSGVTEPGSVVRLYLRGSMEAAAYCDVGEDGVFSFGMEGFGLTKGEMFTLVVNDASDNSMMREFTVGQKAELAQIVLDDVARTVKPGDTLSIIGSAEPGEKITLIWASAGMATEAVNVQVIENGRFSADVIVPAQGSQDTLRVFYTDKSDQITELQFTIDGECFLDILEEITEDSSELKLRSDPGATGSYWRNTNDDNDIEVVFDSEGYATVDISGLGLMAEDVVNISVHDAAGNVAINTAYVNPGEYEPLSVELVFNGNVLDIHVAGRPGAEIGFEAYYEDEHLAGDALLIEEDGEQWFGVETQTGDGTYTVCVGYTNGVGELVERSITVDLTAPEINVNVPSLAGEFAVSGTTEPGSIIALYKGDEKIQDINTTKDGFFDMEAYDFTVGEYEIVVSDASGNQTIRPFTVREAAAAAIDIPEGLSQRQDGAFIVNGDVAMPMTITGTGEPGTTVMFVSGEPGSSENTVKQPNFAHAEVDGNGQWSVSVEFTTPDQMYVIAAGYSDQSSDQISLYYDPYCTVAVDGSIMENETTIEGLTDPGAIVYLYRGESIVARAADGGTELVQTIADESGAFTLTLENLEQPLRQDETLTVRAFDAAGNWGAADVTVGRVTRAPIRMNVNVNDAGWTRDSKLEIHGTAEPGMKMTGTLTSATTGWSEEIGITADGYGDFVLRPDYAYGEITVELTYADGYAAESAGSVSFKWDTEPPMLGFPFDRLDASIMEISGACDPGQSVDLIIDGEVKANRTGGDDGMYTFNNLMLKEGQTVAVRAVDAAGNETYLEGVVTAAIASSAGTLSVSGTSFEVGQSVGVQGWVLCNSSDWVFVEVCNEAGEVVSKVRLNNKQAMSDEEIAAYTAEVGSGADAGYNIDLKLELGDWAAAGGTFRVRAFIDSYPEANYLESDDAVFEVTASATASLAYGPYIGETYAIGFDAEQPRPVYDGNEIVLTGWFYGSSEEAYSIDRVMFAPADAPHQYEEVETYEIDAGQIPAEQGVCYLPRSAVDAAPAMVREALGEVVPANDVAGFVLSLQLGDLPAGDYVLTLVTRIDGPYTETAKFEVTIGDGQPVPPSVAESIATEWYGSSGWPTRIDAASSFGEIAGIQMKLRETGLLTPGDYTEGKLDDATAYGIYDFQLIANDIMGAGLALINPDDPASVVVDEATLSLLRDFEGMM